jgi:SanA protein
MFRRYWKYIFVCLSFALLAAIWAINYIVVRDTHSQLYSDISSIPKNKVGLLLGTAKYNDKSRDIVNSYYRNRIDAAAALYMAGKIDYIIVSGDNSPYYNEPAQMRQDLIAKGVPARRIFMDNSGFRTLDSILRCRDIFGQDHFTIISQKFHNERALYIANHKRVTAVAYNAEDGDAGVVTDLREKLARVKMMLDLLFNKQATLYGESVKIE